MVSVWIRIDYSDTILNDKCEVNKGFSYSVKCRLLFLYCLSKFVRIYLFSVYYFYPTVNKVFYT